MVIDDKIDNLFDAQRIIASVCKMPMDDAVEVVNDIAAACKQQLEISDWVDIATWAMNYDTNLLTYRELKCYIGTIKLRAKNASR